jgi:hypothetical protein
MDTITLLSILKQPQASSKSQKQTMCATPHPKYEMLLLCHQLILMIYSTNKLQQNKPIGNTQNSVSAALWLKDQIQLAADSILRCKTLILGLLVLSADRQDADKVGREYCTCRNGKRAWHGSFRQRHLKLRYQSTGFDTSAINQPGIDASVDSKQN